MSRKSQTVSLNAQKIRTRNRRNFLFKEASRLAESPNQYLLAGESRRLGMRGALLAGVLAAESLRDGDQACATAETFYASGPGDGPVDAECCA